ncbi:MAG: choice-of-anchor D domain-containing protein, partial [Myxococcota bacterium]
MLLAVTLASGCNDNRLVSGGGRLSARPGSLDFGDVAFGTTVDQVLTLSNTGNATVTFERLSIADAELGFSLVTLPTTLASGAETTLTVRWLAPGALGSASTKLLIESDAENAPVLEVPLVGRAHAPSPDAGREDAGLTDAGVADAGVADAGVTDAGVTDAGVTDAGGIDAGGIDAGGIDAGGI